MNAAKMRHIYYNFIIAVILQSNLTRITVHTYSLIVLVLKAMQWHYRVFFLDFC